MDFLRLNEQAEIETIPKVHAIVMTHCGWNRQTINTPDRATQAYLAKAIEIAKNQHLELLVQNLDGKIGWKNSYGNDPRNIKG